MVKPHKKQLSDEDLTKMVGGISSLLAGTERVGLISQRRAANKNFPFPQGEKNFLDLHGKTEEQAWGLINELLDAISVYAAANGNKIDLRRAQIVTGASGILKEKFQQWATESIISHRFASWKLVNRGCYEIVIRKEIRTCDV